MNLEEYEEECMDCEGYGYEDPCHGCEYYDKIDVCRNCNAVVAADDCETCNGTGKITWLDRILRGDKVWW